MGLTGQHQEIIGQILTIIVRGKVTIAEAKIMLQEAMYVLEGSTMIGLSVPSCPFLNMPPDKIEQYKEVMKDALSTTKKF